MRLEFLVSIPTSSGEVITCNIELDETCTQYLCDTNTPIFHILPDILIAAVFNHCLGQNRRLIMQKQLFAAAMMQTTNRSRLSQTDTNAVKCSFPVIGLY